MMCINEQDTAGLCGLKAAYIRFNCIDLYQILMNQHKVQVFHDVVKMIKKPRVIQAQNLYSYRVVAQSSPFSGALAMQKVSRSKTVFSDAFKEYNDPYKFLQVLKGKDPRHTAGAGGR